LDSAALPDGFYLRELLELDPNDLPTMAPPLEAALHSNSL
jgi:hypothetical protein